MDSLDKLAKNIDLKENNRFNFLLGVFRFRGTVIPEVLAQVALNIIVTLIAFKFGCKMPDGFEWHHGEVVGPMCIPSMDGHKIVGGVLAFLLVFRTNISYTRFFEGRTNLGGMMNNIRDMMMVMEVHCFKDDEEGQARRFHFRRKINIAFAFIRQCLRESRHGFRPSHIKTTGTHIEESDEWFEVSNPKNFFESEEKWLEDPERPILKYMILPDEIERFKRIPIPLRATMAIIDLNVMIKRLGKGKYLSAEQVREFNQASSGLLNSFRTCCRVVEPGSFPYQYAHLLNFACFMFVYSLPFALAGDAEWHRDLYLPIFLVMMITIVYYGIQRIATDLIDPFGWEANDYDLGVFGMKIECETRTIAGQNPGKIETFVGKDKWKPCKAEKVSPEPSPGE